MNRVANKENFKNSHSKVVPESRHLAWKFFTGRLKKGMRVRMESIVWHGSEGKKPRQLGVWAFAGRVRRDLMVAESTTAKAVRVPFWVETWERNGRVVVAPHFQKVEVLDFLKE